MPTPSESDFRQLPNALVIGPQKAGTSWIHAYLKSRGDVSLPRGVKETFYFDQKHERGLAWYARHFSEAGDARRTVEVAPTYFHNAEAPRRIVDALGTIPLVCTLRDPVSRIFSQYLHRCRNGQVTGSLRATIEELPALLEGSKYASQLRRWGSVFALNNIRVLFLEKLIAAPEDYAREVCLGLDLPFDGLDSALHQPVNQATVPPSPVVARYGRRVADAFRYCGLHAVVETAKRMGLKPLLFGRPGGAKLPALHDDDRRWLADQLADEIDDLEQLLNVDLAHWKSTSDRCAA